MRVICAGGGTGGHINPAIAIAKHIAQKNPESEFLFVGTKNGMEKTLVPKAGFSITFIDVCGFKRSLSLSNLKTVYKAFTSLLKCKKIIKDFKPDVVVGTGGYVSGPVLAAASFMKIPTVILEQNVFAGMTSKMLSKLVDTVCLGFEETRKSFPDAKKVVLTGTPIRDELFLPDKESARKALEIDSRPFVVCFGGSLGAETINNAMTDFINNHAFDKYNVLFATGENSYKNISGNIKNANNNIKVVPYIYNMDMVMNAADLLICRSGAITTCEIAALGKPSVLIPSPNVTDNHQHYNAKALSDKDASVLITEQQLKDKPEVLNDTITSLLKDKEKLQKMSENALKIGIKDGCERIYNEIKTVVK